MLHYVYSIFRQTHLLDIKGGDTCSVWRLHSCCHAHSHPGLVMGPRWDFTLRCYFRGREFSIRGADTYINIYIFKTAMAKEHVWRTQSNEATKLWLHWILWISSILNLASLTPVKRRNNKRQLTCYMISCDATKVGGPLTILRLLERLGPRRMISVWFLLRISRKTREKSRVKCICMEKYTCSWPGCCSLNWISSQ